MEEMIMASNAKAKEAEKTAVKPIVLRDDVGNVYVLEFNRDTIKFAEARGFKVQVLEDGVSMSAIEELFFYAFRMHHPNMSKANTDKILYEDLGGLHEGMLERLVELFLTPFNTLIATSEDAVKNSKMTVDL